MLLIGRQLSRSGKNSTVKPGVGALTMSGLAPTVTQQFNTLFLNHFNGTDAATTFPDEVFGTTWTRNINGEIDTAQAKFGVSSVLVPQGVNEYLEASGWGSAASPHTGSWTVEGWIRWDLAYGSGFNIRMDLGNNTNGTTYSSYLEGDGDLFQSYSAPSGGWTGGANIAGLSEDTWYHWALVRNVDTGKYESYFDGNRIDQVSWVPDTYSLEYCRLINNTDNTTIWFDEWRFKKGAVYTTSIYAVPSGEFSL